MGIIWNSNTKSFFYTAVQVLQVLIIMTVTRPSAINNPPMIRTWIVSTAYKTEYPPTMIIDARAISLTRQLIHLFCSQFRIMGPKVLLFNIHWCHFSEDRAKHAVANSTNGVVGNRGKNTPSIAVPRKTNPSKRNIFKLASGPWFRKAVLWQCLLNLFG